MKALGRCAGLALLAWAVLAGEAQGAPAVDAGALRADVQGDPWRLELTDAKGRSVLAEHPGTGPGPTGTLGFRTAAGWQHATRVLQASRDGGAYVAELATTDPARGLSVRLEPAGGGVISLDARISGPSDGVSAIGMGFEAREDERYLGFGERSNAVDQSGGTVENYVSDGPYQEVEYPFVGAIAPPWGLRDGRTDATYYPVPWLLSSAGYGVLVDNEETSLFRLRSDSAQAWSLEVVRAPEGEPGAELAPPPDRLRLRFFAGPKPADALRRFTRETGRQPEPAAPWALGTWYQADDEEIPEVEMLRKRDAPLSVLQTYLHYLPCGAQVGDTAAQRERTARAHDAGVAITTYFNPMVCTSYTQAYEPAAAAGALTTDRLGNPYVYRYGANADQSFFVSQYDFFTEAGEREYARVLDEAVGDGYDGWMEDFGEYTPLDSVSAGAIDGTRAHNPYATEYHCAAYEATKDAARPLVRYQRSGWTGTARCTQVVWGGDPTTSFGFDGLRSAVTQALSIGTSGVTRWGSDIGGFFALGANRLTPELLTRWVQLGAVSATMRTQANGVALPSKPRPQVIDADQIDNWRRYTKLHTQLYPYMAAAEYAYQRTGLPLMRHLALAYPGDAEAARQDDEFLFGPDLLAAPVLDEGARERRVYLPRGRWVDLWRSASYRKGSGGLRLGKAKLLRGRRTATVPAPLEELPLLVRAGAVLPLLPPSVDTLARYGNDVEGLVSLADKRRSLRLLAFPRGRSKASAYDGERIRSVERRRSWKLTVRGKLRRRYRLEASLRTLRRPFVPCRVDLNGRAVAPRRWSYARKTRALRVRFSGKRARLEVRAGGCSGGD